MQLFQKHESLSVTIIDLDITTVWTGVASYDILIGFILFMGTDTDTGTDRQEQVKFLPFRSPHYFIL